MSKALSKLWIPSLVYEKVLQLMYPQYEEVPLLYRVKIKSGFGCVSKYFQSQHFCWKFLKLKTFLQVLWKSEACLSAWCCSGCSTRTGSTTCTPSWRTWPFNRVTTGDINPAANRALLSYNTSYVKTVFFKNLNIHLENEPFICKMNHSFL
jgi:hypothetical protein